MSTTDREDDLPEIAESVSPTPGLQVVVEQPVPPRERTRRTIAFVLVFALVGLLVVGAIGWICYGDDTPRMQNFAIIFSPITTLFGTVIGFYFSSTEDRR